MNGAAGVIDRGILEHGSNADHAQEQDPFVRTDAGLIGVSVSLILIVIWGVASRGRSSCERSADARPRHRLVANWARQKAVTECIHQVSELGADTEGLLNRMPAASPER
jgi:hypothetical protein